MKQKKVLTRISRITSRYVRIGKAVRNKGFKMFALPESKRKLHKELGAATLLGQTSDNKDIYLLDKASCPAMMREIGRLREISFRAVGEGTGKARDIDHYDNYYQQIILWNPLNSEIIGGYRIGAAKNIIEQHGIEALYIHSLFTIKPAMFNKLQAGIELGRSFIQPKYWGKRNLEHLWMGIGAYLYANPQIRYLFGPVSLPDELPETAKSLIVHYYSTYYGNTDQALAQAKLPYRNPLPNPFTGENLALELSDLRNRLKQFDMAIPTLYKHYTDLCHPRGTQIVDFNIDPDFNHCLDALMLVDLNMIKEKKAARYIDRHAPMKQAI